MNVFFVTHFIVVLKIRKACVIVNNVAVIEVLRIFITIWCSESTPDSNQCLIDEVLMHLCYNKKKVSLIDFHAISFTSNNKYVLAQNFRKVKFIISKCFWANDVLFSATKRKPQSFSRKLFQRFHKTWVNVFRHRVFDVITTCR